MSKSNNKKENLKLILLEKKYDIVALFGCVVIFAVIFALYKVELKYVLYPAALCVVYVGLLWGVQYVKTKKKHKLLNDVSKLSSEILMEQLPSVDGVNDKDYQLIIQKLCDEHNGYSSLKEKNYEEILEYYTMWVHQIKTPIAAMKLNLANEDSEFSRKIKMDLNRIEQYVDMVLVYLRLDSSLSDYVIREHNIGQLVKTCAKRFSSEFINRKIRLVMKDLDAFVITDSKWLEFVLDQLISNALKYTNEGSVTISFENSKLVISDTGIGIDERDIPRLFEKGYTGINGRDERHSSGIGLYLCKKICDKLGHDISVMSKVNEGTTIEISFKNEFRME